MTYKHHNHNHKNILNVDTMQENQGFRETKFEFYLPAELKKENIHKRFIEKNHRYHDNSNFIKVCEKFIKMVYVKQVFLFDKDGDGYVHLASNILKSNFGSSVSKSPFYYKYIISSLEEVGLLKVDNHYVAANGNGVSKGYKVLINKPGELVNTTVDKDLVERLLRNDNPNYLNELKRLSIDEDKYVLLANLLPNHKRDHALLLLQNWYCNRHFTRVDDHGRIHSWLTQLPKEMRSCFTIEGESIFEVDIHACQPFLLLIAVKESINHYKRDKQSLEQISLVNQEIAGYIDRIQKGEFYKHLYCVHNNKKKLPNNSADLDRYKKSLFKNVFFSELPDDTDAKKMIRVFKQTYPTIYSVIEQIQKKEGYKSVAQRLQQYESEIMGDSISRLKSIKQEEFFLRFHDAILCKRENCELVADVLNAVLLEYVDVFGKVKKGNWGRDFDQVVRSQNLPLFSVIKKHRYDSAIGKQKNSKIRRIMSDTSVDPETRNDRYSRFLNYYDNDQHERNRREQMKWNYLSYNFEYPSHWSPTKIKSFNASSISIINRHLKPNIESDWEFEKKQALHNLSQFTAALAA